MSISLKSNFLMDFFSILAAREFFCPGITLKMIFLKKKFISLLLMQNETTTKGSQCNLRYDP